MARPKLSNATRRSICVRVRVTPAERTQITENWEQSGEPTESAFIRKLIIGDSDGSKTKKATKPG